MGHHHYGLSLVNAETEFSKVDKITLLCTFVVFMFVDTLSYYKIKLQEWGITLSCIYFWCVVGISIIFMGEENLDWQWQWEMADTNIVP